MEQNGSDFDKYLSVLENAEASHESPVKEMKPDKKKKVSTKSKNEPEVLAEKKTCRVVFYPELVELVDYVRVKLFTTGVFKRVISRTEAVWYVFSNYKK